MGKQRRFWGEVFRRAWRDFGAYLKSARDHIMGLLTQLAVAFLVLRFAPGLGDFRDQASDLVLLALAVPVAALFQLLFALLTAPGRVHSDSCDRVDELEVRLGRDADLAAITAEVEALYWEGLSFYKDEADYHAWKGDWPNDWMRRVEETVRRHYPPQMLFLLKSSPYDPGAGHYAKARGIENYPPDTNDLAEVFAAMRRYLYQLESIIHYDPKAAAYEKASLNAAD